MPTITLVLNEQQIDSLADVLWHARTRSELWEVFAQLGAQVGNARCADCGRQMFGAALDTHECAEVVCCPQCGSADVDATIFPGFIECNVCGIATSRKGGAE